MAERYFGNSLSDLQAALTARDRMLAEQNIASQGNTVRFTQGLQQLAAQRAAQQQAADQAAMQNALAQQQLQSSDYFNRGRLANESDRIKAEMELAKQNALAQTSNAEAERKNRLEIANIGATQRGAGEVAGQNEMAIAADNLANILNQQEKLQTDLAQLDTIDAARKSRGDQWFTLNSTAEKEALPKLAPYFGGQVPQMAYNDAITQAKARLQTQLSGLQPIISSAQNSQVASLVTKTPSGWVSTFKPRVAAQDGGYFPIPQIIPAPQDPSQRKVGALYATPRGPLKWSGTGWLTP